MARQKSTDEALPLSEPITETVTYLPGPMDPTTVKWAGHTFHANVPKDITGHADGSPSEKLNFGLIESARSNKHFRVGNSRPVKEPDALPKTADQYRAYLVGWLNDASIEHVDDLIARFAKDRDLQTACEVGSDDYSYLGTLFMPRLHQIAKMDEMNDLAVAGAWARAGFNVLPW